MAATLAIHVTPSHLDPFMQPEAEVCLVRKETILPVLSLPNEERVRFGNSEFQIEQRRFECYLQILFSPALWRAVVLSMLARFNFWLDTHHRILHYLCNGAVAAARRCLERGFTRVDIRVVVEEKEEVVVAVVPDRVDTIERSMKSVEVCGSGPEVCAICLEQLERGEKAAVELPCSHLFHGVCVRRWLMRSNTCPLCRSWFDL